MKVVILAGGFGTRLGNLAEFIPKPMVRIGNMPIIWHIMKLYSHYGFKEFVVSLGYKAEILKDYFRNFHTYSTDFQVDLRNGEIKYLNHCDTADWQVTLADTGIRSLKGARVKRIEHYLDDVNLLTYGDGVADVDLKKLVEFHKQQGKLVTITGVYPPARFGEIKEQDGRLLSFEEKPQASVGLINGGFMVFNRGLLDYLNTDESCDLETRVFPELAAQGQIAVYKHLGKWECVDNERDLLHLNKLWDENNAFWRVWDRERQTRG